MEWIPDIEMIKMPLPDANNWSSRIYELLKETDLENLSYSQFQGVAEKLFIEPENEDEMRRLVLVQLARMAVRGDWDGFISGGSSVPANADYLLAFDQGTVPSELTNARKLVVGNNISMAHGAGDNDDMTISATPGGSDGQIQYNVAGVLSATGLLSTNKTNELTLVAISGDGQINISSSTKAVSLLCDENQKLKVKGATNTFILDVSSSSGGITFPDGTTQTTAASGGGGSSDFNLQLPATATNSGNNDLFVISRQPGWGSPFSASGQILADSGIVKFFPWIAPKTGDIDKIYINIDVDGTGDVEMAVFSDSNGVPDSKIGGDVSYTGGTGGTGPEALTPASTISITKGTQYWVAVFIDSGTTQIKSEDPAQGFIASPRFSGGSTALSSVNVTGVKLESQTSIPNTVTASNLGSESDSQPRWGITYA